MKEEIQPVQVAQKMQSYLYGENWLVEVAAGGNLECGDWSPLSISKGAGTRKPFRNPKRMGGWDER